MKKPKNINAKLWGIMVEHTKIYLILFAVLMGVSILMAFCIIVGNYAY